MANSSCSPSGIIFAKLWESKRVVKFVAWYQILTFCGSLRSASSNRALLTTVERLAPEGISIRRYEGIAELPHFTPDLDHDTFLPAAVRDLRDQVAAADGLLFAVPEYMHGLPGSFKNALDWMVGCQRFPGKPVALAHVSARHAFLPGQLEEVLKTMAATLVPEAGFNLGLTTNNVDVDLICSNAGHKATIVAALEAFRKSLCPKPQQAEEQPASSTLLRGGYSGPRPK